MLADNPRLTARLPKGAKNPLRIILDSNLRTPLEANVVSDRQAKTWIITGEQVSDAAISPYEELGVTVIPLPATDPDTVLRYLGRQRIMSLFVEGGSAVNWSFIGSGQINQLVQYMAPKLIGGKDAPGVAGGEGFDSMKDVLPIRITSTEMIGEAIKIIAEPQEVDADVYRNC